ncbi:MAG TPA: ATP phosphoribosyltransferase regulatory subunit [Nitrospira sp.]|nr:ATP phosphoribosyltransferase regulatory subunit [Nitrospira sp.]HBR48627.1 ATP phosphoribosyltransferase regulatory subunit [Nitrospira sp.]
MAAAPPARALSLEKVSLVRKHSLVPVGMATILPEATRHVRHLESELLQGFYGAGYDEIILPTFEYLDVLAPGLEPRLAENSYKIIDRTTGRILLLRPDVTAQIARTVAMGMVGARLPLRLSYRATVFRYEPEHVGRDREIFQVGAELIGTDDPSADCEMITVMIESLRQVGLQSFKVSLGHVGFFKGLLVCAGLSADGRKRAEEAAARKDLPRLEEILLEERVGKRSAHRILDALELCGTAEVLVKGRILAKGENALLRALDRLASVYGILCASGFKDLLLLDLGEFRGFDYYDGVVFDVFSDGIEVELGGGGRYNHLIGRFGRDLPSTGFGLNVDRLFRSLNLSGAMQPLDSKILVVGPTNSSHDLVSLAQELRQAGLRVLQRSIAASGQDLIRMAADVGRASDASTTIVIGTDRSHEDRVLLLQPSTPQRVENTTSTAKVQRRTVLRQNLIRMLQVRHEEAP